MYPSGTRSGMSSCRSMRSPREATSGYLTGGRPAMVTVRRYEPGGNAAWDSGVWPRVWAAVRMRAPRLAVDAERRWRDPAGVKPTVLVVGPQAREQLVGLPVIPDRARRALVQ